MALLNEAYDVLSDSERRKKHINELQSWNDEYREPANDFHNVSKEYENNKTATAQEEEQPGIAAYIVLIFIAIVIIGCGIRFVPDLIRVTWDNIMESIKEILATFY